MGLQNGEKKGMIYYYDYSQQLKHLTDEQFRDVIYVLAEMERTGEVNENKERLERIKNNALTETIFMITLEQQKRASTAWHNINKAKHKEKYEKQEEKEKPKNKNKKVKEHIESVDDEKGKVITENNTYNYDIDNFPEMMMFENSNAILEIEEKNKIKSITPDE